MAPRIVH